MSQKLRIFLIIFIQIAVISFSFVLFSTSFPKTTFAYGDCSQYGFAATYNSITNSCSCSYGNVWGTNVLGQPYCVSGLTYCTGKYGYGANYNSLNQSCECSNGYKWDYDSVGNKSCVAGVTYCTNNFGYGATYDYLSNACKCQSGYKTDTDISGNQTCIDGNTYCHNNFGYNSQYDYLKDSCKCKSGYVTTTSSSGTQTCEDGLTYCMEQHGSHASYDSLSNSCSCNKNYTFNTNGQCVEKENNVYFYLKEIDSDQNEAIIEDEDFNNYLVKYDYGCLDNSIESYLDNNIIVDLGTDFNLDISDKIILPNEDETCDILSEKYVSSTFSLKPDFTPTINYIPLVQAPTPEPQTNYINLNTQNGFTDVDANYAYKTAVDYVKSAGIVEGYADGTFKPNSKINRAEFTKIMITALKHNPQTFWNKCFPDVQTEWFAPYVCYAKNSEIINGYQDGKFKPNNNITVPEALKIVLEGFKKNVPEASGAWYQKYVNYAQSNGQMLTGWTNNLNHEVTRGEMAELMYLNAK